MSGGSGDFSIGGLIWPGLSKLGEESGEVQQVVGKIIGARGEVGHWDGTQFDKRLESELGDLMAAITFVVIKNNLNILAIERRRDEKLAKFNKWHDDPVNLP